MRRCRSSQSCSLTRYLPGERITLRKLTGTLVAFFGVAGLFGDRVRLDAAQAGPMIAIVASARVCCNRRRGKQAARLGAPSGGAQCAGDDRGAFVLMAVSLAAGDGFMMPRDAATWGAIAYLAIAGSVLTFLIYFTLLKTWSVTSLSFISVFTPAIALLLGFVFLDERPTLLTGGRRRAGPDWRDPGGNRANEARRG